MSLGPLGCAEEDPGDAAGALQADHVPGIRPFFFKKTLDTSKYFLIWDRRISFINQ
jgi:hypothetical protein